MSSRMYTLSLAALSIAAVINATHPASAASSTSRGEISVAQVVEMLQKASGDRMARQVLTAYLAGVGETVGLVTNISGITCQLAVSLSSANVSAALQAAASGQNAAETPATPLIVQDALARADCRI